MKTDRPAGGLRRLMIRVDGGVRDNSVSESISNIDDVEHHSLNTFIGNFRAACNATHGIFNANNYTHSL